MLKFAGTDLKIINNYILTSRNHLMLSLCAKAPDTVPEEKYLWINSGFTRIIESATSAQPDKVWYSRVREDLKHYAGNKDKPDKHEMKRHDEKLALALPINDFYMSEVIINLPKAARHFEQRLFEQHGDSSYDISSRTLEQDLMAGRIKFEPNEFMSAYKELRQGQYPEERRIANAMITAGYHEAFGMDFIKGFLADESNWAGINQAAQERLAGSLKAIVGMLPPEQKDIIRELALKHAGERIHLFSEALYESPANQTKQDLISVITCGDRNSIQQFSKWLFMVMEKPAWVNMESVDIFEIKPAYFDAVIETAGLMIREEYRQKLAGGLAGDYDLWNNEVFRFLWAVGILGMKRIKFSL
ncbi:MAG TPA: hypothetical protein PLB12_11480 [Candidatus Goldiibacteriota bacterium]|nr:hypothetical protein [Candidatus Goldiibacteriota bacterium]